MNLLAGLEKFGLDISRGKNKSLFEDEDDRNGQKAESQKKVEEYIPTEEDFLLERKVQCKVCDKVFPMKMVKNGRVRRMEPDADLRPRFQYIDTLKYDVTSCPYCGYTAMNRYFDHISGAQMKLIREEISSRFHTSRNGEVSYSYDAVIDRYKLSLMNTLVKHGRTSERAYTCLKISWLLRGKIEEMPNETEEDQQMIAALRQEEEEFYQQAYEGFVMACAKEVFPICGMEQNTMDYLLAYMSFHFEKYELASKYLAGILGSKSASRKMKDMALDLKEQVLVKFRVQRQSLEAAKGS